jgi:hypothetical protein
MSLGLALADAELASTAARGLAGRSLAAFQNGRGVHGAKSESPAGDAAEPHESTHRGTR